MVKQYNNYSVNGTNVNGNLTLGENLADLGAVILAYRTLDATNLNLSKKDKQDFFINYANLWKRLTTPEKSLSHILCDPHSPARFRVFMVRNIDEFYDVFQEDDIDYKESHDSMYLSKENRIQLW
jgi:putative endopeptidase